MTNEQREAIEMIEDIKNNSWTTKYIMSSDSKKADVILSLIKEQQEEIEGLRNKEVLIKRYFKKCDLIKQKDKQIDLMAEFISKQDIDEDICIKNITNPDWCNEDYTNCKACIKQYFAGLVEKE